MISNISIDNFKCFNELTLPINKLTLLTGFNASGKSTVLQSLLLLSQALRKNISCNYISVNGSLVKLGSSTDILHESDEPLSNQKKELSLGITYQSGSIKWSFLPMKKNRNNLEVVRLAIKETPSTDILYENNLDGIIPDNVTGNFLNVITALKSLIFIGAGRMGVQDLFPSPEDEQISHSDVGSEGEYAPWWFESYSDEDIPENRRFPSEKGAVTLRRQMNAWLSYIFPGAEANTLTVDNTGFIQLQFKNSSVGEWRRPANIGYGLTYIFPIIVAGLLAKPGQILVIDSPEAHLHPMGQSRIGMFLAQVSASGVQVIIETHSDHVLNGVRIAVSSKIIESNDLSIHFFNRINDAENKQKLLIVSPKVDNEGSLSEWPEGFFDQSEKDLSTLMGW
ncbi:hypothetical protein PEC106664_21880 [Pectobacterium carotovorum subsp. carotovorum]|nr:hypothetical protein PEC106664_21880 [Pectobacterium carotovorum subsp. carotovorum]